MAIHLYDNNNRNLSKERCAVGRTQPNSLSNFLLRLSEQEYDLGKTFNYFYGHSWDTVAHLLGILLCLVSSHRQYQQNLQASTYKSQYIYYIWNIVKKTKSKNKAINIEYKLIEMSQTRARGRAHRWILKTHILRETKLPLITHVSVSKSKDKRDNIRLSPFYYSGISTILRSIFFSKRTWK